MGREVCIICKTRSSSRFSGSVNYEELFVGCFGEAARNRTGKLCEGCRFDLKEYAEDKTKTKYQKLDVREGNNATKRSCAEKAKLAKMEASRQSERVNGMLQREMSDIQLHVNEFPPAQNEATSWDKQVFETEMLQDEEIFALFEEQNIGHFLGLPSEVWQCILGHLSFQQLLKFGQTCRRANELSEDPLLWREIYQTENKTPMLFDFGNNWKSAFAMVTLHQK